MADVTPDEMVTVTVTSSRSSDSSRARSSSRQPGALIKLGPYGAGVPVSGWLSWSTSSNSFYEADTFQVSFSVAALPKTYGAAWFGTQKEMFCEIFAGFPANQSAPQSNELQNIVYGRVDTLEFDPVENVIHVSGRDLTAVFIDAKIASTYVNQTSSAIASKLAASHGLAAEVTATKSKVGTYYQQDQVQLEANRSEWDLLAYLARREGFVCYVKGQTLYFQPDPTNTNDPYQIQWTPPPAAAGAPEANVTEIKFSRTLTVAKGVAVTARSANLMTGRPVVQSYPSGAKAIQAGKASPFGEVQNFYFTMAPGHSAVDVQAYAKAQYDAIVAHEMKMMARMPGDNALTMLAPVRVSGTGTAWDQIYYPRRIDREMNLDDGYTMTLDAQNVNTDTSPAS